MHKENILQKNYTLNQKFYQLKLPLNIDYMIPVNDSVRLLSQFIFDLFQDKGKSSIAKKNAENHDLWIYE